LQHGFVWQNSRSRFENQALIVNDLGSLTASRMGSFVSTQSRNRQTPGQGDPACQMQARSHRRGDPLSATDYGPLTTD